MVPYYLGWLERCWLVRFTGVAMAKAVREASGKAILVKALEKVSRENEVGNDLRFPMKSVTVTSTADFFMLAKENPWLDTEVSV